MHARVMAHVPNATNGDIVQLVTMAANDPATDLTSWPDDFDPNEAALLAWETLRELQYVPDMDGQTVKAPRVLLATGVGDCKSFAVFAAKVLKAAGWRVMLRFVKNEPGDSVQHVYVIAERRGIFRVVDGVMDQYNVEPLHFGVIDIPCTR